MNGPWTNLRYIRETMGGQLFHGGSGWGGSNRIHCDGGKPISRGAKLPPRPGSISGWQRLLFRCLLPAGPWIERRAHYK